MYFPREVHFADMQEEYAARMNTTSPCRFRPNRTLIFGDTKKKIRELEPPIRVLHPTIEGHRWDPRIQADVDAMLCDDKHKKRIAKRRSPLYTQPVLAKTKRAHAKRREDGAFRFLGPNK